MATITLEPQERDCPYNRHRMGRPIVDQKVLIDGQHRATFRIESNKRAYRLHDATGAAIHMSPDRYTPPHLGDLVPTKGAFLAAIKEYLAADRIPTIEQQERTLADRKAAAVALKAAELAAQRDAKVRQHGVELYDMLQRLVDAVNFVSTGDTSTYEINTAQRLLKEINEEIKACVDAG